jgi:hypothetical protein
MISTTLLFAVLLYLSWWEWHYLPNVVRTDNPRPIAAVYKFNHWLPRFLMWCDGTLNRTGRNRAVTLPHPFKRAAMVCVARHYITGRHRAHEVAGHGAQIVAMGPTSYWFTYLWHYVIRRGSWAQHMMEKDAKKAEARHAASYVDLGTP